MTGGVTDSQLALYEGLIALAWTDGVFSHYEKVVIRSLINDHRDFNDNQRHLLRESLQRRTPLCDIWPRITNKQDRARFLDYADMVMKADGVVDPNEEEIYRAKLAKHLGTLDVDSIKRDLDAYRVNLTEAQAEESKAYRDYAMEYGLIGFLKRLFSGNGPQGDDGQMSKIA